LSALPAVSPRPRLFLIDSLRGVAAGIVMLYHLYHAVSPNGELRVPSFVDALFNLGEGGVQIFFVLSGFVIAQNLEELPKLDLAIVGRFMLRRSIRLDPVYWSVIALNAVFLFTLSTTKHADHLGARVVAENMLYLNGVLGDFFVVPVGWTLTFEVQFYLALAFLMTACRRLPVHLIGDVTGRALLFLPLLSVSVWMAFSTAPVRTSPWAVAAWHMFFLGVAASWLASKRARAGWFVAASVVATALVFVVTREVVTLLALVAVAAIVVAIKRGALGIALGGRPLQWLGKISYSLYLVHPLVGNKLLRFCAARIPADLTPIEDECARWALMLVAALACCVVAWILWRVVEMPAQRFARRVALAT
jgi:peptidoglycan/LPS O-acetylase OafA/YrhL